MFGLPKEAAGAIFAALIAGLISLLGLIISKEQKISEFRQAWIDGLRENIALIITHLEAIRGATHAAQPSTPTWLDRRDHFVAINQAITCVRLRLNPDEASSRELLLSLTELENVAQAGDIATSRLVGPAVDKVTECCNIVMKEEWQRVRDGEKTYRLARYGSVAAVTIALALLAGIVARSIVTGNATSSESTTQKTAGQIEIKVLATPCVGADQLDQLEPAHGNPQDNSVVTPPASQCIQIKSDGATIQVVNRPPHPTR